MASPPSHNSRATTILEQMTEFSGHNAANVVTYWGSCKLTNDVEPWTLSWSESGGYSAVSAVDFHAGDQIVKERPTTWTRAWHPFAEEDKIRIEDEVGQLNDVERDAFYEMSNAYPDVSPASAGIYMTNAFDMPYNGDEHSSGMYLAIARLNHSCVPNAQQTHIPHRARDGDDFGTVGYEVLYATRDVKVGEELCDCYIELRQTTEQRRKELYEYYRFVCTCPACGPAEDNRMSAAALQLRKEDDSRRKRALKLESDILEYVQMGEVEAAVDLGDELVRLLEHEKTRGWGERYIAEACMTTSTLLYEQGKVRKAFTYASKAHAWNVKLQGEQSVDSMDTAGKLSRLMGEL